MRDLTYFENDLVSGGADNCRVELRELVVDSSLLVAPVIGGEIGMAAVAGMGLGYTVAAAIGGAYVGIVAVPVVAKVGLEIMFGVRDILV
jgi:hypothetical protein